MEWRIEKINTWFNVSTGGTPSRAREEYWGGDIKWMASGDINKIRINDVEGRITKLGLEQSNAKLLPKKTVMVALNGQGKTRGMVAITETELTCNQSLASLVPKKENTIDPDYLFWNLYSRYTEIRNIRGGEFRSGLNLAHIREIKFPVPFLNGSPDIQEQKRIAEKLKGIFNENKSAQKLFDRQDQLVSKLKHSLLSQTFSRSDWKNQNLVDISNFFGDGDWIESKDQSNQGIWLVQTGNVGVVTFRDKEHKRFISTETFERLSCTEIFQGDILISRLPDPVGKACLIPNTSYRMITSVDCAVLRLKEGYDSRFVNYLLNSEQTRKQVYSMVTGSSRKRISRKNLATVELPIPFKNGKPDLIEQKRVAGELEKSFMMAENLSNFVAYQRESFNHLLTSVLRESFKSKEVLAKEPAISPIQNINLSPVQQAMALILRRFQRGEMVVAKLLYLGQTVFKIPLGISFTQQTFGPYSSQIKASVKDGLSVKKQLFSKKGIMGKEVLTLGINGAKILSHLDGSLQKQMNDYLDKMMPHYFSSDSHSIELLATVCKIIEDEKTSDDVVVRQKLQEWKPGRFQDSETFRTLSFIKKNKWDQKILQ